MPRTSGERCGALLVTDEETVPSLPIFGWRWRDLRLEEVCLAGRGREVLPLTGSTIKGARTKKGGQDETSKRSVLRLLEGMLTKTAVR